jgi:predicted Zn-dependent protease
LAAVLIVCALNQEQMAYPYSLREPESPAEAGRFIVSHPTHAPYRFSLLRELGERTPPPRRLREIEAALWLEPTNPYYRDAYATDLLKIGRTDDRLEAITASVAESPILQHHDYLQEDALRQLSSPEQRAIEAGFDRALERGYPEALNNFAAYYAALGRFADQAALYERAAAQESDDVKKADLLVKGGLAYLKAGEKKEQGAGSREQGASVIGHPSSVTAGLHAANAERLFRAAVAATPADPKAYRHLVATTYAADRDIRSAMEIIGSGVSKGAPALPLYLSLAEAARRAGGEEDSKTAMESAKAEVAKSIKNGEDPFTLHLILADGARLVGDRETEAKAVAAALERRPRSPEVLGRLAGLYLEKQNFDRAALYLNRIAGISPDSADLYYRIAQAEEARYRFAAAGRAYARAVELAPGDARYKERYDQFRERVERNRSTGDGGRETGLARGDEQETGASVQSSSSSRSSARTSNSVSRLR